MRPTPPIIRHNPLVTLAALAGTVAALYLARELLIPLALAAFLAILLAPLVARAEWLGLNRIVAVVLVAIAALIPVAGVAWMAGTQIIELADDLPSYKGNLQKRIEAVRGSAGEILGRASDTIDELGEGAAALENAASAPARVTVVTPEPGPIRMLRGMAGPLIAPIGTMLVVLVFVVFILVQWEDLRDRLIRLISRGQLTVTTQALDELSLRIGKFLRTQFLINASNGALIALALSIIGVPNALLWGFLGGALRFIPYAGAIVSATLPIVISLATSDGWAVPLQTIAFFVVSETISNNFIEPWLYGSSTGISSVALLVSAVFWGWLWGLPGLLLSTPLTVCLLVAGRHVPQLHFLNTMFGDEPVLSPADKIYQRLLARDADEAAEVAERYLADHSVTQLFDDLLVPALRLADTDAEAGSLDADRHTFVLHAVRDLAEEAGARLRRAAAAASAVVAVGAAPVQAAAVATPRARVLCVPARGESDSTAGLMLETLLWEAGVAARAMTTDDLGTDLGAIIADMKPESVVISAVPPSASMHARQRLKLLQRKAPGLIPDAGLWGVNVDQEKVANRMAAAGTGKLYGSLGAAVADLRSRARPAEAPVVDAVAAASAGRGAGT